MKLPGAGGSIYLTTYIMGWIIYTTWKSIVAESESCKNIVPIFTISFLDWPHSRADRWWRHLLVENFVTWFSVKPFRFWPRIKKILENCQKEFFSQPIWSGWTKIHFSEPKPHYNCPLSKILSSSLLSSNSVVHDLSLFGIKHQDNTTK